jgi:acylphosphatase
MQGIGTKRLTSTDDALGTTCYNRAAKICKSLRDPVQTLARRFYIAGTVQGVGFRFFAERAAAQLGITGYVKNLPDGRVEIYAIGSAQQLDALKNEFRQGPRMASVSDLTEADAEIMAEFSEDSPSSTTAGSSERNSWK